MDDNVKVDLISGVGKKSGKPYEAVRLTIGDWSQLVFPRSPFELNYIKEQLEEK